MDPISLLIGALVLTACAKVGLSATADTVATLRASKAGAWEVIDRQRERRASFWERLGAAWAERRRQRHEEAGGDGEFRPGARAYAADLYHGFWEDRLERRTAKRAARGPYAYDPDRPPWHVRFDAAVLAKVERARRAWGQRRPEPVEDTPIDELFDQETLPAAEPVAHEPGTWTVDDQGARVDLAPADDRPVANATDVEHISAADAIHGTNDEQDETPNNQGGTTMSMIGNAVSEILTNEDARRNFTAISDAADQAAEALEAYEIAQERLKQLAGAGTDGMLGKRFDAGATAAQVNISDLISAGDIAAASSAIEGVRAEAQVGVQTLSKYHDSEAQVAAENIDATTLAATSS